MGFILGAFGGGGALLSIPILLGIYHLNMIEAASVSYWILLLGAAVALFSKNNLVKMKWAIHFAALSTPALLLTRAFILPMLPNELVGLNTNQMLMALFICVVFIVYFQGRREVNPNTEYSSISFYFKAISVGILGGLVGAGGGFLIVPVLISTRQLKMSEAVATSLAVILINATAGILTSWNIQSQLPWSKIWVFVLITVVGAVMGGIYSKKWEEQKLKNIFSLILLFVGIGMTIKEIISSV